ncbi:hypothetical protein [Fournierella massiliensis]|uniref:Uncharacterized protein n=1 Tax=Allofournierella massiliensis TaxID=1650663 RepID=A0ABT7URH4_9FIRM|nr:hypothetical protein [Fournierella massiliensis]MDM8201494.1 hypothetical protein [Fournierella massiliensis]
MIMVIWALLALLAAVIQAILGSRKLAFWWGAILPIAFLVVAGYMWWDLSNISIPITVFISLLIPPILLPWAFLLFYWKAKLKGEKCNET